MQLSDGIVSREIDPAAVSPGARVSGITPSGERQNRPVYVKPMSSASSIGSRTTERGEPVERRGAPAGGVDHEVGGDLLAVGEHDTRDVGDAGQRRRPREEAARSPSRDAR